MRFRILVCLLAMWVCVFAASAARAATIVVPAGGNLQAALDNAQPGDVITLAPNATYVGNFVLRNKGAITDYITIRSAAPDASLPPAGVRMKPSYAALLPKIKSSNNMSALRTATAANHWKLMFLEFQANVHGYGDIISLGAGDNTQTQLSQVPYALVLDRLYLHGDPVMGQKRGIALHSRDTDVINSWVSDCKVVGQEAQAISGFNGPGNYLIENNHLEGATQNFLIGGADPVIPNLVTSNITFRYNHLTKPLAWRDPIMATPTGVTATAAPGAGSLAAGTYFYKVQARGAAGQTNSATSKSSIEVSATIAAGTTGAVAISWKPIPGAQDYIVWGRTSGGQNMNWTTTAPSFTDTGAAGASGSPASETVWLVKNIFELKNAQHVLVEGNLFENNWVAGQPGIAILFTPRNQNGTAPWVVVQDVKFQHNIVRHSAGAVSILGIDNINGKSLRTNNISITNNLFEDISSAWGSGGRVFQSGDGPDKVTIDHNTIFANVATIVWFYGAPTTNFVYTNNMSAHNTYGINGSGSSSGLTALNAYAAGFIGRGNVLAGGKASLYPAGNYFPSVTDWQASFENYATGDYRVRPPCPYPSIDGLECGADLKKIKDMTAIALSGDNRRGPSANPVKIVTTSLPNGLVNESYEQTVACSGGSVPDRCVWRMLDTSRLPAGMTFEPGAATFRGKPTAIETGSVVLEASDPADPTNRAEQPFQLTIDRPKFELNVPTPSKGQVGVAYTLTPTVNGAVGPTTWTVASGNLPDGLKINSVSGVVEGVPTNAGTWTASVEVKDSLDRLEQPVTITINPAPLVITATVFPNARYKTMYSANLNATGGTGSFRWSLFGGSLPLGLVVNESGTISGVPESVRTFNFVVKVTDASGTSATAPLTLTVEPPDFTMTLPAAPAAATGRPYQFTATATGNVGTVTWSIDPSSGSLPPGLTIGPSSGIIAGTPTTAGTFSAVIQAKDSLDPATRVAFAGITIGVTRSDVVLYMADAPVIRGAWSVVDDATAAGGRRVSNPDAGAAKLSAALASPANYFELTFTAEAGVGYHLWMRGKASKNLWANDSVYVQFSGSVDAKGTAINRIGSTMGAAVSIEEGANAGLSEWGWADDSYGGLASPIYFASTGTQTIRVQVREDGVSLDQIVLSADRYLTVAPGVLKNDATIVQR